MLVVTPTTPPTNTPAPSPTPAPAPTPTPAPTPPPVPTPVLPSRGNLPAFIQQNQALGTITASTVNGGARVTAAVNGLLPSRPGVTPVGVNDVETALHQNFESFLDTGRKFPIKVGRNWYEATVKATLGPSTALTVPDTKTKVDMTVNSGNATAHTGTAGTSATVGVGGVVSAGVGPYGAASVSVPLGRPVESTTAGTATTDQRAIRSGEGSVEAVVPVTYTVSLADARNNPVGTPVTVASTPASPVDVTLHIPDDLSTMTPPAVAPTPVVPANGWGAALEHPAPEAVVDLDTDLAFATVAAQLHPSITRLGAPGRTALRNFLDPTTIRDNLGPALNGWVVSPDLVSPHGSRAGVVRMRATPVSAELVGTNPTTVLRLHESTATSTGLSSSTKSGFDVTVGVGGGAVAPTQVGGTAGVTAGYSARTTESSHAGTGSSVRTGVQIKGDTGLYKVTVNLEVQTPHGATITVPATSYVRLGVPEASSAGLQVPPGTSPDLTTPTPTPRFAPPYLAAAAAAGNVKVGQFAPANQVQGQVEDALRGLPGFDSFLPSFADPNSAPRDTGRNASDLADQMANQRKLTTELSPTALKSQMDSLLGPGVQVRLKKQGLATNEYVNVTVKARLTNPVHLGQADARNVRGAASTGPRLDSSTTTQKGWSAGVEGKVVIPSTTGSTSASPAPAAGAKYTSSTSTKNAAGPTVSSTALNVGSPNSQLFQHDVAFDVEVTKFTQNRSWVKRVTPGSPFLKVPEPTTVAKTAGGPAPANAVALPAITGTVNLWVSDSSAMTSDPAVFAPGAATVAAAPPNTTISTVLTSPKPAVEPWLHVEAVANTEAVRNQAIAALNTAAGGDSALGVPGTDARNRIDKLFSPESIKANLRTLVDKGVTEGGMRYGRRVADRTGAVGVSVSLNNPKLVSISDDTGTENASTGGAKAGDGKTGARSVDLTAGVNTPMKPATGATGSGAIGATAKWTPWSTSSTEATEIGGSVDRNRVTPAGGRTVLVQLDADVTVVGESRSGNTLYGGTPRSSASVVTLPGGVFVRVSEDTARGMGLLPPLPAHTTPPMGAMTPPATLKPGEPGALGLGLVESVPNLSGLVPELRTNLGALGTDLMPPSVLKDSMNNLQRLTDLTSDASVKALVDSALDGGVPLLVHDPGVFGKDTYQVTLKATLGTPAFDGVVNDGVEMEHTTTGTAKFSQGQGRGTGWSVGLRVPGSGLPATGNPNLSGSAGAVASATLGQAHSNSTTGSTTEQVGHLRAGSGPAVRYTVPVTFELVVEKGNQVVGRATSGPPQDMSVRVLADNQKVAGATPANTAAFAPTTTPRPAAQGAPATANAWQANPSPATPTAAPAVLPPSASVENLRGAQALREAAVSALTAAGANRGITGKGTGSMNALHSALSSESLQPNLPGMLTGALEVPGLHEAALTASTHADVKVYAKLVNPRLEGLSDGVNLENPRTTVTTTSSESKHSETGDVSFGAASGGVSSKNPDVGFSTGGVEGRHASEDSSATSGGATDNRVANLKPQGRSGLVTYDVEYRVVADLGGGRVGVVDLQVPAAARVRMPAPEVETALGKPLPPALDTAQTGVKDAAAAWRAAEVASDAVRHATDETINRLAPDLATANADVATRQGAATTADDNLTAVRDSLPALRANADTAARAVADAATEVATLAEARGAATARADLAAAARADADAAVTAHTAAVADLTAEVGAATAAVTDANARAAAAQTALDTHLNAPRPAPVEGQLAQPDPVGPRLAGELSDATIELTTERGRLNGLTTALTEARGELDQAVVDQGLAVAEVNAAAVAVAEADTDHATAVTDLDTARNTLDTENGRLRTAKDEAQRLQDLLDLANADLDTAVGAQQDVADRIAKAEQELERARNAADARQQAWWDAKTGVDQQVEAFNTPAPPVAGGSTPPPAPPSGGAPPVPTATPSPSAAPAPAPRGPSPERSFDFAPGTTALNPEQSATVDALAADLAESAGKRADRGYLPPVVEVSGANAPAVKAALDATLAGAVDVAIAEGGRPDGADVHVDWDLERPEGYVPPEAPKSVKVTDTVITASGPRAPHPILSDQSWRHSDAPSADWSRPSNPVSSQDVLAARAGAPVRTVRSEDGGLLSTSTIAPGKVDFTAWRGPIAYDRRSVDVDGVTVQDFTVKVFLDPSSTATPAQVDAVKARTVAGVESVFNQGHRLPGGDQLHVTVEFTANPADAHGHIAITGPDGRANQLNWPVDTDPRRLAHEVGHFLGLQDEYRETGAAKPIFQHQDGKGRVVADNGPMTAGIDSPTMEIKPRNLWLIETRADALASPNAAPPSASYDSPLAPPNAPSPDGAKVTRAQEDALNVQGGYAFDVGAVDTRTSLVESIAVTLAPNSPDARQALVDEVNAVTSSATIADVAAAAGVRVHVLGTDGGFTSHGPITGLPVHVVENGVTGDGARYHATKENVHIGRPGVSYPGPTTIRHEGVLKTVNRGEFEIETIAGRHQVRIYTAVVNPQTITPDADGKPTSQWKDIQQDPKTGDLTFSTGKGDGPLWAGAGRPQRALQWLTKYEHTDGGKPDLQNPSIIKRPVLRSFLVPLDTFNKITTETKIEGVAGPTVNVDQRGEPNQFGIGGDHLAELIKNAEPGSLTSYPANPTAGFAHESLAGRVTPLTEMKGKVGLSPDFRSDAVGKAYDPWFTWKQESDGSWKFDGFRNDAHGLHDMATRLREHDVTWQQVKQGAANRTDDARIEPDHESIPNPRPGSEAAGPKDLGFDARVQRLNQFLNEVGPASVNVRKITDDVLSTGPAALRTHLAGNGVPSVDQAAYQRALDQTVSDAARDAAKNVDAAVKQVKGPVQDKAELRTLIRDGFRAKSGPQRDFTAEVADRIATDFAAKVRAHPSLALLDDASRGRIADQLRVDMDAAVRQELGNLDGLDALAKGGKKGGWLSGPRGAEFGRQVAANMAARPAPTAQVAIDPDLLATVAENKVLKPVVTGALDAFTGQDLLTSSPDDLKSVVSAEVLPALSNDIGTALRTDPALALADQSFRDTMANAVANNARARAGLALATFTFDRVDPAEVDALMARVPEIATQAEIGALVAADSDRAALDFNTRTEGADPFLNSYFQWNAERGQVFDAQRAAGDDLSASINAPDRDPHAVVDQLIARFGELDRKFDEVATAPQLTPGRAAGHTTPFTFYEHSQMVLGQYFKLTAAEDADARLIPVDALAKAILFHDIEKNNAKNQFGDGQGRHDREPEHKLAVEMMDRYRGLWANQREFAAARAIVDSDPFGFHLRGKITADEAFIFIHDLAGKVDGTNPDNPRKLFDEFHQYYQADFSSYTPDSTYVDRDGATRKGPNAFTDRFQRGADGIELTGDGRHFQYAGNHDVARRMRDLAAMFADPATVAEHHARITGQDVAAPNAPARADAEAYPRPPHAPATERVAVPEDADPVVVTAEARRVMADITEKYGIEVDSTAGASAVKESHPGTSRANLDKVTARGWDPRELKGLQDALAHYEPILGAARESSTRAGHPQELTTVGAVSRAIRGTSPFLLATGEYIASHTTVTLYPMAVVGNSFGGGAGEVEATATRELAHGLLQYALPEYTARFGTRDTDGKPVLAAGAEPPHQNTRNAADDFKESIESHVLGVSTFAGTAPEHAAAIADLAARHPDVFERRGVEPAEARAERIAAALSAELADFSARVGTWTPDGGPDFAGEPPTTGYGATNPDEDLAETAMVYFLDPDRLRAQAPQRFAFLDGLVAGWRPDTGPAAQPPDVPARSPWTAPSPVDPVPSLVRDDDGRTRSITGDLFSEPATV
ncbi:hypothetical protein [Umezawaea sp.]|uniref:hypothetical protein n=1 Tax=Umezawaea sp. TaxID=1955258 RepID=UPI002ED0596E